MVRIAVACVFLSLAAAPGPAAAQARSRIPVAVMAAETSDGSTELAARLTSALRATVAQGGLFELYDTIITNKSGGPRGGRPALRLPTRYVCTARISRAQTGWAQATITINDDPFKDPVVRLGSPVLIRDSTALLSLARLAWERLAKLENKRLGAGGSDAAP